MKSLRILATLATFFVLHLHYAQGQENSPQELSLDTSPIEGQFEFIYKKSGNYRADGRRYEVVRVISLDKLRKNVMDTLSLYHRKKEELNTTISGHETTISSLNKKLEETTADLAQVTEEKDSMSFLGIPVSKGTYNFIVWTIIMGLLFLLLLFIYRFRKSNFLTQEAKQNLSDLETEYENHRRRALEREQRISRQLQDEINKYKKSK